MTRALAQAVDIGDDEPVTLAEACRLFFGGRISPSALRTEAMKGRLVITQIARKDFVTRRAIEEMKERCRVPASRPVSGSEPKPGQTDAKPASGSSSTVNPSIAQDAARMRLEKLSESLRTTSPANINRRGTVVPLKSQ
jgi:hypothetical protein